jgi:putative tryptophan/tyrosine transport system substrate-binding protein
VKRREFITLLGGAAAWPLAARAQQGERMRRIGVLMSLAADDRETQARHAAFLQGLQQLGWTDGRNARIELNDLQLTKVWRAQRCEVAPSALALSASLLCSGGEPDLWCALDAGFLHRRLQVW